MDMGDAAADAAAGVNLALSLMAAKAQGATDEELLHLVNGPNLATLGTAALYLLNVVDGAMTQAVDGDPDKARATMLAAATDEREAGGDALNAALDAILEDPDV